MKFVKQLILMEGVICCLSRVEPFLIYTDIGLLPTRLLPQYQVYFRSDSFFGLVFNIFSISVFFFGLNLIEVLMLLAITYLLIKQN